MKKSELRKIIKEEVDKVEADAAISLASKGFDIKDREEGDFWYWIMGNGNYSAIAKDISKILNLAKKYPESYKNGTLKFGPRPW